jgi:hypothetical protein
MAANQEEWTMIVLQGVSQRVDLLRFSPDGRTLVAPCSAGVQVWKDLASSSGPVRMLGQSGSWPVDFTPDGRKLVIGPGKVLVYDLATFEAVEVPFELSGGGTACGLSRDGSLLVIAQLRSTGNPSGRLYCRPLNNLRASVWSHVTSPIYESPLFLAGGNRFMVLEWREQGRPFRTLPIYLTRDVHTGKTLAEVPASTDMLYRPILSADRKWLACRRGIWASIFQADDLGKEPVRLRNDNRKELTGLAFHPSGRYLAATSNDATVKLYDTATWEMVQAFNWDIGRLRSIAFSHDGMLAAAGGERGQIVVWDVDL